MSIDRKLIRQNFLKMKEAENIKMKEDENIKKQIQDEINNQNNEIKLMRHEDITQRRIMFYEKIKVNEDRTQQRILFYEKLLFKI